MTLVSEFVRLKEVLYLVRKTFTLIAVITTVGPKRLG